MPMSVLGEIDTNYVPQGDTNYKKFERKHLMTQHNYSVVNRWCRPQV